MFMPVTDDRPQLTPLGEVILATLRDAGDWMTRKDLAAALGRPGLLGPHDLRLLDELEADGLIEVRKEKIGTVKFEFQYKAK